MSDFLVMNRLILFIFTIIMSVAMILIIKSAKGGKKPFVRKINGLEAVDEAVGRATEMGRPVHFSPGISSLGEQTAAQTLAGLSVLGYVSRLTAKYDTPLIVTIRIPEILPISEEIVKQSYLAEGKPDAYNPNNIRFLSDEQFAYAAGCLGIMNREKVATNIMMGAFWAESLIFAEGGFAAGAIQIAGTANTHQLPFFIAACDYTLIGEELFAAGAYLSQDPLQLGSIAVQDIGKLIAIILIVIGTITTTFDWTVITDFISKYSM
ncbi:DUF6754 domain-containing protein [Anaerobranca gottschalkii]|uniref:DUF6754 domain-containing protein n=1 Tax=Anaerobranca gottschalkii DSM 13577 TaxID=1120990 RepID=A0A1I0C400_9FIRM|nr:DUF6754 domain-containing protein [Anaerobranca gottschalkii]SET13784.1 hypothetical protein SAMN03080614_105613 [Anaerobranca gottschalkii DSM 13577]